MYTKHIANKIKSVKKERKKEEKAISLIMFNSYFFLFYQINNNLNYELRLKKKSKGYENSLI